ncbi:MAG TPA: hypothetical protein VLX31_14065 [Streptosporangiaceae bacterium]|nr:hypothetical protein [Streptosporangiaceae bacterium]
MNENYARALLQQAAIFLDSDPGSPGFLERFAATVGGSPPEAARALDTALTARNLAGTARFAVGAGDVRTETTSSGAHLSVGLLSEGDDHLAASVRVVDSDRTALAGVALRVTDHDGHRAVVTDEAGRASLRATGASVFIQIGDFGEVGGRGEPAGAVVLPLRAAVPATTYVLAAADQTAEKSATEPSRWQTEAGGVQFTCLSRMGGSDLTLLLREDPPEVAAAAAGTHGVLFRTWGRAGSARRWIVPLAPGPLGFTGALYGTDEDWLHESSVQVYGADEIAGELGDPEDDEAGAVLARSVRHADALHAWRAMSNRITHERQRATIRAALDRHGTST